MHAASFGTDPARFHTAWPGEAVFGPGSALRLVDWARSRGLRRLLVVTDARLAAAGLIEAPAAALHAAGVALQVFDGVDANPRLAQVEAAWALWRTQPFDGVVAFGGGSVIDAAKVLVARLAGDAPLEAVLAQGDALLVREPPPFAAVPTTAGTGSESTLAALVKDDSGRKHVFRSRRCRPGWVALDPALTPGLPRDVTASTGFDVVMHALGAATNRAVQPVGEALALDALRRSLDALPRVLAEPASLEARGDMLLASYLAGVAIGLKGVDGIHGLCTPLESLATAPHGQVLAVVVEPLLRFNLHTETPRYARVAAACGLAAGRGEAEAAAALLARIVALRELAGLPASLAGIGVAPGQLPPLVDLAFANASARLNARALSREDIAALYRAMG
jgi:alcohol dehydrogenase class IV